MSSSPTASAAAAASSSLNIGIVYACLALFLLVGIWAGRRRNIGILLTVDEFVSARSSSPSWMSLGTNFLVAGLGVWVRERRGVERSCSG